jgi:tetratricopeptide (TPR) repeat protein
MKKTIPILLLIFIPLFSFANPELEETDQLIIFHTYNGDWAVADSMLDAQIANNPDSPKYYALKGTFYFYTRYFNQGQLPGDSLMDKCAEYSRKAIEIGENLEMTLDNQFFVGTAHGYLSRYYGRQGQYWNAYWAARKCRSYFNDILDENPDYADAYMGLAVIEYYTARMTGWYEFLAWLVGMSGGRDEALTQFHIVAEKGKYCKTEALFVLIALYRFYENDYDQVRELGNKFIEKHPDNLFVAGQMQQMKFLVLVQEKGVDFLRAEFDSLGTKYNITNPGILNTLGYSYLNQNLYDEAIEILKINIELFPDVANGYDSLSEAYLTTGNAEMAIKYSKLCLKKLPGDDTINEEFRENLRTISEDRLEELGANTDAVNI